MKKTQAQLDATNRWKRQNKARLADYQREWRIHNRQRKQELERKWYNLNPERAAYRSQKQAARQRGIGWEFTFPVWRAWWGDDFPQRGIAGLMMLRFRDTGPYAPNNIYKGTAKDNSRDYRNLRKEAENG